MLNIRYRHKERMDTVSRISFETRGRSRLYHTGIYWKGGTLLFCGTQRLESEKLLARCTGESAKNSQQQPTDQWRIQGEVGETSLPKGCSAPLTQIRTILVLIEAETKIKNAA